MKRIFTLCMIICTALTGFAQTDTTVINPTDTIPAERVDTIKVGGMIIIRKQGRNRDGDRDVNISRRRYTQPSNISTNWWIFDFGFSNFVDNTNYGSVEAQNFAPGMDKDGFNIKNFKSRNVNIWFFMQKLNVIKHALNLKYGAGVELNNYFFDNETVRFQKNPTQISFDPTLATVKVKKNKLAADYLTVPLMVNINFTPKRSRGFGISAGVSAGFLYSSRQKIKTDDDKDKLKDDFNLEKWKLSYIGELLLGPVKLYGSYATKSMWEKGLDQTPYTVGVRFSNW